MFSTKYKSTKKLKRRRRKQEKFCVVLSPLGRRKSDMNYERKKNFIENVSKTGRKTLFYPSKNSNGSTQVNSSKTFSKSLYFIIFDGTVKMFTLQKSFTLFAKE